MNSANETRFYKLLNNNSLLFPGTYQFLYERIFIHKRFFVTILIMYCTRLLWCDRYTTAILNHRWNTRAFDMIEQYNHKSWYPSAFLLHQISISGRQYRKYYFLGQSTRLQASEPTVREFVERVWAVGSHSGLNVDRCRVLGDCGIWGGISHGLMYPRGGRPGGTTAVEV